MSLTKITYSMIQGTPVNILDYGILANGTDQTSAIVAALTVLGTSFRGVVNIPTGVKFTLGTVYAAVPVGTTLQYLDTLNYGQYPSYANKNQITYSSDLVGDDSKTIVTSGHHPSIMVNNLGTAGTGSAAIKNSSYLFGGGIRYNNDPIIGFQMVQSKSSGDYWAVNCVMNTPWTGAASTHWTANTVYALNQYVNTNAGYILKCTTAGTSSTAEPTLASAGTAADGTVTWTWVSAWDLQSTRFFFDEQGVGGFQSAGSAKSYVISTAASGFTGYLEAAANILRFRDSTNNRDVIGSTVSKGIYLGGVPSMSATSITGATPTATSQLMLVANGGATNMTNLVMPTSQTNGFVVLRFQDANTTLVDGAHFALKGGVNVTPAAGNFIGLIMCSSASSAWLEIFRSF